MPATAPDDRLLLDATMYWSSEGGGVRRYLLAKRAALREGGSDLAGWRHEIAAPMSRRAAQAAAMNGVAPDLRLSGWPLPGSGGYRWPQARRATARALAARGPAVIEVGDPFRLAWAALDAGQRLGVPTVAYCHSDLGAMARLTAGAALGARAALAAERLAERYLRHVYREFDLVLAPGARVAERLRGLGLRTVRTQPLGVDRRCFHPGRRDPAWRVGLGLQSDARVLLYAGRFAPEKHLTVLRRVLEQLDTRHHLVLIGGGPVAVAAHPRLHVLPFEREPAAMARALASADVFVHAGEQETYGLAPLEAMACGTTVVVRQAAGLAEWVELGAAIGVEANAVDAWRTALAAAFAGPGAAAREAAWRCAAARDWSALLPAQLRQYEQLIARPVAPTPRTDPAERPLDIAAAGAAGPAAAMRSRRAR